MDKKEILYKSLNNELKRQREHIELIASENFVTEEILNLAGSVLTNKYAEGYPNRRYYGGCENVDVIEQIAIDTAKELFNAEHANVQPHSGSQANSAAYGAILQPGDTILGMDLASGGHLTHGFKLNFSGKIYNACFYGVNPKTEMLDYNEIEKIAIETKPKLIIAGASAYSRIIDFKKFREIADKVGAYLLVDMAHIAGLVATGQHPSPVLYADIVTSTTHKTLRGPRGGLILCKKEFAKQIDSSIFPGNQGGPLEHIIAAKAACFIDALKPEYKLYAKQIVLNCKILSDTLTSLGYRIISGGTDNHLILVEVKESIGIFGKEAENILHSINITCNKNSIPFDKEKPMLGSGIRLGTAAMTTRGMKESDFKKIAEIIDVAFRNKDNSQKLNELKKEVINLASKFPLYPNLKY